jgi:chromate transporter
MKSLYELACVFFRIGCFMFGGGAAMLPLLQEELVNKKQWIKDDKLIDYYTIAQSTPGIIAVNVATFTGYNKAGVIGAIVATLSLVTAPILIILLLANVLTLYLENQYVIKAFDGIRIVVVALILEAVCRLWSSSIKKRNDVFLFLIALALAIMGVSVIVIMVLFVSISFVAAWKRGWK